MAKEKYNVDANLPFFGNIVFPNISLRNKTQAYNNYIAQDLNRTNRMIRWKGEGIGEHITPSYIEKVTQSAGYSIVFRGPDDKVYVTWAGLGGILNPEYFPTKAIVANPYIPFNKELEIGKDCVIIKNDTYLIGLARPFARYEMRRIENELTMLNLNIKMRDLSPMSASNDSTFESIKKYLSDLEDGKLASIAENAFWEDLKVHNSGLNVSNIMTQLIEYEQYLKASRDNFIGLNGNFNMKRESITASESDLNEDGLFPTVLDMIECREEAVKDLKRVLDLDWSFELQGPWAQRKAEQDQMIRNAEGGELDVDSNERDLSEMDDGSDGSDEDRRTTEE